VGAASGCHAKRAEVDKTTVVTWAPAVRVLWAADAGKSAAAHDVMCSIERAMTGLSIGSHRAGRDGGGKR
jgi:hypothetical protein